MFVPSQNQPEWEEGCSLQTADSSLPPIPASPWRHFTSWSLLSSNGYQNQLERTLPPHLHPKYIQRTTALNSIQSIGETGKKKMCYFFLPKDISLRSTLNHWGKNRFYSKVYLTIKTFHNLPNTLKQPIIIEKGKKIFQDNSFYPDKTGRMS